MIDIVKRIRRHLADPTSQHRQIALGFFWVGLFVFVGRTAGAAKEMAIAWRYGVSAEVDAYVFIFNVVGWPISIWLSVLTVVLVPLIARLRCDNPKELPRFRAELLGLTLLLGVILGLLGWWGLPLLLRAGWLGLSGPALRQGLAMTGGMALLLPLGTIISLFSVWLLAAGRHRNTLFEAIPAIALLFALMLPPDWLSEPLVWGTVAGYALHATALALPLRAAGEFPLPSLTQHSLVWRNFWNGIGIMIAGQVLMNSTNVIDQLLVAGVGQGALSTLGYASRVVALVISLGAVAIARATLPIFSEETVKNSMQLSSLTLNWAGWVFGLGFVMTVICWTITPWGVSLLFERGAFTDHDVGAVSILLQLMLLQVPFYFLGILLMQYFVALRRYYILTLSYVFALLVKLIYLFVFVDTITIKSVVISTVALIIGWCLIMYCLILLDKRSKA